MIKNQKAFNSSPAAGFDGVFEWDFLKSAFKPTKIEPMDFDCVIERNGRFLCFETKVPGAGIKDGQKIALQTAVATGIWTVIFLQAKRPQDIERWQVWRLAERGEFPGEGIVTRRWVRGSEDDLVKYVTSWFQWANARRPPKIKVEDLEEISFKDL
jgi:hypothetical protein